MFFRVGSDAAGVNFNFYLHREGDKWWVNLLFRSSRATSAAAAHDFSGSKVTGVAYGLSCLVTVYKRDAFKAECAERAHNGRLLFNDSFIARLSGVVYNQPSGGRAELLGRVHGFYVLERGPVT